MIINSLSLALTVVKTCTLTAFITSIIIALPSFSVAYSQTPSPSCDVSVTVSTSQPSVAVGEEFDLTVTLTNNSTEVLHAFDVTIGNLYITGNPDDLDGISFMEHFHIIDSHHPSGRVSLLTDTEAYLELGAEIVSYIKWRGNAQLSHEWLQPGQTTNLRLRLRAVGKPGTINIPVQYVSELDRPKKGMQTSETQATDCYDTDTVQLTVTEGSLSGPLLVQKTLLANDLYDCIRLGEEVFALWQVMNTSDENRYIRLRDAIPGYLTYNMNNPGILLPAAIANTNGSTIYENDALSYFVDGENGILTSKVILIPPHSTLYYTDIFDVSAYATPSSLASTVYVWETDDEGVPASQPGNALAFTNTPIPVCTPLVTKTAVGDYCDVENEATITYAVEVDRIIWGSLYTYTLFDDLLPQGTSYVPTATADGAGSLYENYSLSGHTIWSRLTDANSVLIPPVFDGDNPLFADKLSLSYNLSADDITDSELVNTFTIRNGTTNKLNPPIDGKLAELGDLKREPRRAGDFLWSPELDVAKLSYDYYEPSIDTYYEAALEVASASHSLQEDCIVESYTIDGYKFNDLNGNGRRDTGEPGVESWMIIAQSSEGTFTAVTDTEGYYRIEDLPAAVWQVREIDQLGWTQSAPGGEGFYNVQLSQQVQSARLDFGNWKPSTITGTVFLDTYAVGGKYNVVDDESEDTAKITVVNEPYQVPLEGAEVQLRDLSGNVLQSTTSGPNGRYTFDGVAPGYYVVTPSLSDFSLKQSVAANSPVRFLGGPYQILATSGSKHTSKDFGLYIYVICRGKVTLDENRDYLFKPTEDQTVRDVSGLKVQLQRTGPYGGTDPAKVASEPIVLDLNDDGSFETTELLPGEWQVQVLLADYWSALSENPVTVLIPSGESAEVNFDVFFDSYTAPELRLSSITGNVFRNRTADHLYDSEADVMVNGHTLRLVGKSGRGTVVELQTATGSDGSYRFKDLPEGDYTISLVGVADTLRRGWPWSDTHRVILGENEHVGAPFGAYTTDPIDADLPWKSMSWTGIGNLWTRIDDDGDARADRRNFFSGPAELIRTSAGGVYPLHATHSTLRMVGTDSLDRRILANGPSGGSMAVLSQAGMWNQGLDLTFQLEDGVWYSPTALGASNAQAIVARARVSRWLSYHNVADFTAESGKAPVLRDPFGKPMADVLSAEFAYTPGFDFGLTPKRFDAADDGDGGTGSGGIGTNDPGDRADLPRDFALGAVYPNPFNPATVVPFELASAGAVRLAVYDITGRQVSVLVNTSMSAGRHTIAWDASALPSGVYVIQLRAGGKVMTGKATLLK